MPGASGGLNLFAMREAIFPDAWHNERNGCVQQQNERQTCRENVQALIFTAGNPSLQNEADDDSGSAK